MKECLVEEMKKVPFILTNELTGDMRLSAVITILSNISLFRLSSLEIQISKIAVYIYYHWRLDLPIRLFPDCRPIKTKKSFFLPHHN